MISPKILALHLPQVRFYQILLIVSDSTFSTYSSQMLFFFLIKSLRFGNQSSPLPSRSHNLKAIFFTNWFWKNDSQSTCSLWPWCHLHYSSYPASLWLFTLNPLDSKHFDMRDCTLFLPLSLSTPFSWLVCVNHEWKYIWTL